MGFGDLKKQSSLGSLTAKLVKEVEKQNGGGGQGQDDRLWKPTMDKSATVTLSFDSSLHQKVKTFPGQRCSHTPSRELVGGTLRTH